MQQLLTLLYLVVIIGIFYLLIVRPQQKRAREHGELVAGLKAGDRIVTSGGIYGTVKRVNEDTIILEVSPNVELKMAKNSVVSKEQGVG